ncbi:hypothetical protein IWW57_001827 [Coemansia sp. S610]|nr:hypothetical protein IWW57_001827 [Coemansia sp. S610]
MTNTITPPNTRSNVASQQPTTTDKIKDSVKQAVNKAQNVLTGSNTKTMTPPSSNDAAHVIGTADNKTNVGVRGTEPPRRTEGISYRVEDRAGNLEDLSRRNLGNNATSTDRHNVGNDVVHTDKHGLRNDVANTDKRNLSNDVANTDRRNISNDVGSTDKRGTLGTVQEGRVNQTTSTAPKQANLAPPPPSQKQDATPLGRYQYDPLDRLVGDTAGHPSNNVGGRQSNNVYPPPQQGGKVADDLEIEKPSRLVGATIDKAFDRTERRASDTTNSALGAARAGVQGQLSNNLGGGQGNTEKGSTGNRAGETKRN